MQRHPMTICSALLAIFLLLPGCEERQQQQPEPVVVSKKISQERPSPPKAPGKESRPEKLTPGPEKAPGKAPAPVVAAAGTKQPAPAAKPLTQTMPPGTPAPPERDLPAAAPEKTAAPAEEVAVIKPAPLAAYASAGRIDPFRPLFSVSASPASAPTQKKSRKRSPLTPLEKLDLSQLRLVGVIRMEAGNRALVQETGGKGYVIEKGAYIGKNAGVVLQILKDRIVIEEEVESFAGKISLKKRELKLEKPGGEF